MISLRFPDGSKQITSAPFISIGLFPGNDIVLDDKYVSRRHAIIVNFPDDVWLYDLESTSGTMIDKDPVCGRVFLDGVHQITIGKSVIEVAAQANLLI